MKTENFERVKELLEELTQLRRDIYDYDYDDDALWCIDNARIALNNIIR